MSRAFYRTSSLAVALSLLIGFTASSASADASQLCRSLTTIALAPTDVLFAPYTTVQDVWGGLQDQDDSLVKVAIGLGPGLVWLNGIQVGASAIRVVAGIFEFIPGLVTLPRERSPKPLFTSQDEAEAVYSSDFGPCPVRIGVHYNTIPWG